MRRRHQHAEEEETTKSPMDVVKELDAFPKIPEGYKETTVSGGGVSLVVFAAIIVLVVSEVRYYTNTELVYKYAVDTEHDGKLKINIDMTVAMKCEQIGADVLDLTGQNANTFGKLQEEPVHFELSPNQRAYFDMVNRMNDYMRNEYHAVHEFLWKSGYSNVGSNMPARTEQPGSPPDGCRLFGTLEVNKVAGNFHVTAGKSISHPAGHAHLAGMVSSKDYNFSHRIDQFSYGHETPGIINPLDGVEKVTSENYYMYQYFIQVVPTKVDTSISHIDTYQYAVTERNRSINHSKGSHGVPGIFVKYDLSSLQVSVTEQHKPYWQFLVRLCGIVGGIFATSGLLHQLMGLLVDLVCCRLKLGAYSPVLPTAAASSPISLSSSTTTPPPDLLASSTTRLQTGGSAPLLSSAGGPVLLAAPSGAGQSGAGQSGAGQPSTATNGAAASSASLLPPAAQ